MSALTDIRNNIKPVLVLHLSKPITQILEAEEFEIGGQSGLHQIPSQQSETKIVTNKYPMRNFNLSYLLHSKI